MIEPPYGIIWNHLKKGEVIPFLGAGASLSGRPDNTVWDENCRVFPPSGRELASFLADDASFPSPEPHDRTDLAKVSSYYLESIDRPGLTSRLHDLFDNDYNVGRIHEFLADLDIPLLIVTTNYDDLIERAFKKKSKPFHLVVHPTDNKELAASVLWWEPDKAEPKAFHPSQLSLPLTDTTIIYKMHGSVDRQEKRWDSFVITEEDYVEFLSRMTGQSAIPAHFLLHFRSRRFLFLGYGMSDWNLRVMLKNLKAALIQTEDISNQNEAYSQRPERSWAIQHHPTELEQMLWRARQVNIYDMKIDTFVDKMLQRAR